MHRTIGYLSKRFVHVHPGEERALLRAACSWFLLMAACSLLKPASRSLVLGTLGAPKLPYADLASVLLIGPVLGFFAALAGRINTAALVGGSFTAMTAGTLACWVCLGRWGAWVPGAWYVWSSLSSVLAVALFWRVAHERYQPDEMARLFGVIGAAGLLGGIVGSGVAAVGAPLIGTRRLPVLGAVMLLAAWLAVRAWRRDGPPLPHDGRVSAPGDAGEARQHPTTPRRLGGPVFLRQSRYLALIVALVALGQIVSGFVSYQFNPFLERTWADLDARTTCLGLFFGVVHIAAFAVQWCGTSWVLRRQGMPMALLVLPVSLLAGVTALVIAPLIWIAAVTELADRSLNLSLHQTAKEMLYLPIDSSIRGAVKPFLDVVVFRFGKGVAAVGGILLLDVWHVPAKGLGAASLALIALWLAAVGGLRREYVATLRTMLQARAASRRPRRCVTAVGRGRPGSGAADGGAGCRPHRGERAGATGAARGAPRPHAAPTAASPDALQAILLLARAADQDTVEGRPEEIRWVCEQLHAVEAHARADARELLETLVNPRARAAVLTFFEEVMPCS